MSVRIFESVDSLRDLVGLEVAVTDWSILSQEQIALFAEATRDRQWIHLDEERARRESPYGATIAHGFLIVSLLSRLVQEAIQFRGGVRMVLNYGLNRVRFPAPVLAGSRIRGRITVQSFNALQDSSEVIFSVIVETENCEKPCCAAEWIIRYYS